MKVTKQEYLEFWKDIGNGENWVQDTDSTFPDEEDDLLPDTFEGDVTLIRQTESDERCESDKPFTATEVREGFATFSLVFRRWKKARSRVTLVIEIDKDKEVGFRAFLKSASSTFGAKIC